MKDAREPRRPALTLRAAAQTEKPKRRAGSCPQSDTPHIERPRELDPAQRAAGRRRAPKVKTFDWHRFDMMIEGSTQSPHPARCAGSRDDRRDHRVSGSLAVRPGPDARHEHDESPRAASARVRQEVEKAAALITPSGGNVIDEEAASSMTPPPTRSHRPQPSTSCRTQTSRRAVRLIVFGCRASGCQPANLILMIAPSSTAPSARAGEGPV